MLIRRRDVDRARHEPRTVLCPTHRQIRGTGEDIGEHTRVRGAQVKDERYWDREAPRQLAKHRRERRQTASRRANDDHIERWNVDARLPRRFGFFPSSAERRHGAARFEDAARRATRCRGAECGRFLTIATGGLLRERETTRTSSLS